VAGVGGLFPIEDVLIRHSGFVSCSQVFGAGFVQCYSSLLAGVGVQKLGLAGLEVVLSAEWVAV
jgi:hypothetical protein